MFTKGFLEGFVISLLRNPERFLKHFEIVVNLFHYLFIFSFIILVITISFFLDVSDLIWFKVNFINGGIYRRKHRLSDVESSYIWVSHIYL